MKESIKEIEARLHENSERTEQALAAYVSRNDADMENLLDAERYSLLGGGKRIRPFLVNEVCRMLGGDEKTSMPYACALEMIHTYSLIHDDLPCMDDDDMRRGKPTNHKVFGYATALLAGDSLLTRAFSVASENREASAEQNAMAVSLLASAAGAFGMIGGQIIDLRGESERLDMDRLLKLHAMKTGALIECAARLGALAAGFLPDSEESKAVAKYAQKIGLCFQVVDDILDAVGSAEELGKSVGSDAESHKTTFMTYYTPDEARAYAAQLTAEAVGTLSDYEGSEVLTDLAVWLLERTY
ncbi:MAG: polyprenyl synthetase family protein [Clostridia bacterium]|nr:polyprenyl synthetase family protein [Clostridia bacterium]